METYGVVDSLFVAVLSSRLAVVVVVVIVDSIRVVLLLLPISITRDDDVPGSSSITLLTRLSLCWVVDDMFETVPLLSRIRVLRRRWLLLLVRTPGL